MRRTTSNRVCLFPASVAWVCLGLFLVLTSPTRGICQEAGPWNLGALKEVPKVTWVDEAGPLRKLYYEGELRNGQPTRIFAYCGFPEKRQGKVPAVILIHGGGGKAFAEWAKLWADRGYVALAMDLAGKGPDGTPLPDGGPDQTDLYKLPAKRGEIKDLWTYHAVAACVRGVSLVSSFPEVDADRVGVTGISWGGYLTCIVSGVDDRLKFSIPVYGCGYLADNSVWLRHFAAMPPDWRTDWLKNFDPSSHLAKARVPMLFVNGTNDFAYPLDSYQKSYRLVPNRLTCVTVNMPHGHPQGWAPIEIGIWADQHVLNGRPMPVIAQRLKLDDEKKLAETRWLNAAENPVETPKAAFHWTTDTGDWTKRRWQSKPLGLDADRIVAEIPSERPIVFFVTFKDDRGATVSTEHEELK